MKTQNKIYCWGLASLLNILSSKDVIQIPNSVVYVLYENFYNKNSELLIQYEKRIASLIALSLNFNIEFLGPLNSLIPPINKRLHNPSLEKISIKLSNGDFVSDNLLERFPPHKNIHINVFSHGASSYRNLFPGYTPKGNSIRYLYTRLIKPFKIFVYKYFFQKFTSTNIYFGDIENLIYKYLKINDIYVSWDHLILKRRNISNQILKILDISISKDMVIYCPIPELDDDETQAHIKLIKEKFNKYIILVKPHHSDLRNYSKFDSNIIDLKNEARYLPLEIIIACQNIPIITYHSSIFTSIKSNYIYFIPVNNQKIRNFYEREYWALTNLYSNVIFNTI